MSPSGTSNHTGSPDSEPQRRAERVSAGHSDAHPALLHLAELLAGSPHNLVAAGERARVYERHVVECDALAATLSPSGRWMDLGTGGGLPGLVLAVRHPGVTWTLVDATAKKVSAVQQFATELGLPNVEVVHGRAETLAHDPAFRGRFGGVVTRAVAPLPTLAELCRGFVAGNGVVVALKGPRWQQEVDAAGPALRALRLRLVSAEPLESPARDSWVVTMRATGAPPAGYPRRDGVPKGDPIR